MRVVFALAWFPLSAQAGVSYDLAIRAVDDNLALTAPTPAPPTITHCFVEGGKVRIGGPSAKRAYVFFGSTMLVIDNPSRTVHVLKTATTAQFAAHYTEAVKQLEDAAAAAPEAERATARQKADDLRAVNERLQQPVAREFKVTARYESVDGKACRIWEELEEDAKRLELCVAPAAAVPGAADILAGMKTLSQFRQGSDFAIGVEFGLADWWPDMSSLGGLPLLIREYKFDSVVSETLLTAMRPGVSAATQFDIPEGYRSVEGPDYVQWYMR